MIIGNKTEVLIGAVGEEKERDVRKGVKIRRDEQREDKKG